MVSAMTERPSSMFFWIVPKMPTSFLEGWVPFVRGFKEGGLGDALVWEAALRAGAAARLAGAFFVEVFLRAGDLVTALMMCSAVSCACTQPDAWTGKILARILHPDYIFRMFDIGQKVACINDDFSPTVRHLYKQLPRKDEIYTVREVSIGRSKVTSSAGGENEISYLVLLEELRNPNDPYMHESAGQEMGFRSDRFAPLEELENTEYAEAEEVLVRPR
jgi:hypothetical protein